MYFLTARLIIGTPYDPMYWVIREHFYNALKTEAQAHEHISDYTLNSMRRLLTDKGFIHARSRYVGCGELVQITPWLEVSHSRCLPSRSSSPPRC